MKKLLKLPMMAVVILTSSTLVYAKEHVVSQKDKKFSVSALTIKTGDTVKFVNDDKTPHHLMYKVGGAKKNMQQKAGDPKGTAVVQKFDKPEEVDVRCAIHPKMRLKIKVEK